LTKPNLEYKPWEEYPELWKTEAQFWTFLRGALRRGLWEKSPIKLSWKNAQCTAPPEDYTGKGKKGAVCALTGVWTPTSKAEVDHIDGHKPLLKWEDLLPYAFHLIPPKGSLAYVEKNAHKIKSYAERMGITFEEATIQKKAIEILKDSKKCLTWFKERNILYPSNAKLRREAIIKYLEENKDVTV
jgi:hypothetical protein